MTEVMSPKGVVGEVPGTEDRRVPGFTRVKDLLYPPVHRVRSPIPSPPSTSPCSGSYVTPSNPNVSTLYEVSRSRSTVPGTP